MKLRKFLGSWLAILSAIIYDPESVNDELREIQRNAYKRGYESGRESALSEIYDLRVSDITGEKQC